MLASSYFRSACVTGGAGFIGSHVVRHLLQSGLAVTVLDDLSTGRIERLPSDVRFVRGSILDEDAVLEAMTGADVVFHLAARVAIRSSFQFVVEDTETNATGTAVVLRCASRIGSVRRFISTSSMAVYADSLDMRPVAETHTTQPISPYGVSKLASEQLTHLYCANTKMESIVLRLFNTYGPGQTLSPYVGVVTIFVNQLRDGKRVTIFGDGLQQRDFVHVQDVAQGFVRAMQFGASGSTYNIGSGKALNLRDMYQSLKDIMQSDLSPLYAPAAMGELRCSVANIDKASRELEYEPQYDLERYLPAVFREIAGCSTMSAA